VRAIITRADARQRGMTKFFIALPCKIGHVDEQYVVNGKCVVCQRDEMRARYWRNPQRFRDATKEWMTRPGNREKRSEYSKKHKKLNPTAKYNRLRQEKIAGRPRPNVCDLCNKPNKTNRPIQFDHCHQTGEFRGWLCRKCNSALGLVSDDIGLLLKMVEYLKTVKNNQNIQGDKDAARG
jgi:hypothetical protein